MTPPVQVPFLNCSLKETPLGQQLPQQLLQMSAQDRGIYATCWHLCHGLLKRDCTDEGLYINAEDPGAIPSSAAELQWPFPFKAEVVFHQGYPAWRRAEPSFWVGSL